MEMVVELAVMAVHHGQVAGVGPAAVAVQQAIRVVAEMGTLIKIV